jgi:hypothetical protein
VKRKNRELAGRIINEKKINLKAEDRTEQRYVIHRYSSEQEWTLGLERSRKRL